MPETSEDTDLNGILRDELPVIQKRREQAGLAKAASLSRPANDSTAIPRDDSGVAASLTGVALSGGGTRSACFNLGLLQAFHRCGLLRHIDYVSSVSGGGYIGSWLTSLASLGHLPANSPSQAGPAHPLDRCASGRTERVNQLVERIKHAYEMRSALRVFNRYITGLILINGAVLSGVLAMAAFLAWLFRLLDEPDTIAGLKVIGFKNDIWRALFPAAVLAGMWVLFRIAGLAWRVSLGGRQPASEVLSSTSYTVRGFFVWITELFSRWLLLGIIAALLLALAALLGTGDIYVPNFAEYLSLSSDEGAGKGIQNWVKSVKNPLQTFLLWLLGMSLLPYFTPKKLIHSGMDGKTVVHRSIYWLATRGLLIGMPLFLFGWFAREDISGYNERRVINLDRPSANNDSDRTSRHAETKGSTASPSPANSTPTPLPGDFVRSDFDDWGVFWRYIKWADKAAPPPIKGDSAKEPTLPYVAVAKVLYLSAPEFEKMSLSKSREELGAFQAEREQLQKDIDETMYLKRKIDGYDFDYKTGLFSKLWKLTSSEGWRELTEQWEYRVELRRLQDSICQQLSRRVLDTKSLAPIFLEFKADDDSSEARQWAAGIRLLARQAHAVPAQTDKSISGLKPQDGTASPSDVKMEDDRRNLTEADRMNLLRGLNWEILKAYYDTKLIDRKTVFSSVVWAEDQRTRGNYAWWLTLVFLVLSTTVSLNATSLHNAYREALVTAWVEQDVHQQDSLHLANLHPEQVGAPYPLWSGAVHLGKGLVLSCESSMKHFLFSPLYCGTDVIGYQKTERYAQGRLRIDDAMSLSGAAVSPLQVQNPLLSVLLFLANLRLGQWLPNSDPRFKSRLPAWFPFGPARAVWALLKPVKSRSHHFVTDGGHHENLGLEPLLRRRCRVIVVSDASEDKSGDCPELLRVLRRTRLQHGYQFVPLDGGRAVNDRQLNQFLLELTSLASTAEIATSRRHYLVLEVHYPVDKQRGLPSSTGYVVYLKPSLTGDEPPDVVQYRRSNPAFPNDPSTDQLFNEDQIESYRQLGEHIGREICAGVFREDHLRSDQFASQWTPIQGSFRPSRSLPSAKPSPSAVHIKTALDRQIDDWQRKFAARELLEQHEPDTEALVDQAIAELIRRIRTGDRMGRDRHAGVVLIRFGKRALPKLREGIERLAEQAKVRSMRVISTILMREFDRATVDFLLQWLPKLRIGKARLEVRKLLKRLPLDDYVDEPLR